MVPDVYCNGLHILEYGGHTILRNVAAQKQAAVRTFNVAIRMSVSNWSEVHWLC